jgi:hypothetical protein
MLCTREASAGPCLLLGTLSLQSKLRSGQPLGALERDEREEREREGGKISSAMNLLRVLNEHSVNHNAAQPPAAAPLSLSLKTQCAASHRSPTPCGPQIKSIPVAVVTVARMLWHAAHHSPLASSTSRRAPVQSASPIAPHRPALAPETTTIALESKGVGAFS